MEKKLKSGKIYAIITARGASKGFPRKNLYPLAGIPLIAHSINAALSCPSVSRCLVSTEDAEIKAVSIQWGAEVIDRPIELASDSSLSQDVVRHLLETLRKQGDFPDYFVLLQPTSPLRKAHHIEACLKAFLKSDANCAISMTEAEQHPYKMLLLDKGDNMVPFFNIESLDMPRQLLPKAYQLNGAIYVMPSKIFLEKNTFFVQPIMPYLMKQEEGVDIDSEFDIMLCEFLIEKMKGLRSSFRP